jgi:hypothetical protein
MISMAFSECILLEWKSGLNVYILTLSNVPFRSKLPSLRVPGAGCSKILAARNINFIAESKIYRRSTLGPC